METTLKNIPGLPPEEQVVIKKLGFGSMNLLRSRTTIASLDPRTNDINARMDLGEYMKWVVVFGIKEASFFAHCRNFDDRAKVLEKDMIPAETGDYLFNQIKKLNRFEEMDDLKKKSEMSSKDEVSTT